MQENQGKIIQKWVKKSVKAKAWNDYYSQLPGYCYLGKAERGVWIGFLTANKIPFDCEPLTEVEKVTMQKCLREQNTFPRPFDEEDE